MAISKEGAVYSWGCNETGQLGHGGPDEDASVWCHPRQVKAGYFRPASGLSGRERQGGLRTFPRVVQIACGARHAVALTENGGVVCWGDSSSGQCGVRLPAGYSLPTVGQVGGESSNAYETEFDEDVEYDEGPDPAVQWNPTPVGALAPPRLTEILSHQSAGSVRD